MIRWGFKSLGTADASLTIEQAVKEGRVKSLLAADAISNGKHDLKDGVKIDGQYDGAISVSNKRGVIWVSESARVKGALSAQVIYVEGRVQGDLRASTLVIKGGGVVEGRIFADNVILRDQCGLAIRAEVHSKSDGESVDALPGDLIPITSVALKAV